MRLCGRGGHAHHQRPDLHAETQPDWVQTVCVPLLLPLIGALVLC